VKLETLDSNGNISNHPLSKLFPLKKSPHSPSKGIKSSEKRCFVFKKSESASQKTPVKYDSQKYENHQEKRFFSVFISTPDANNCAKEKSPFSSKSLKKESSSLKLSRLCF